MPRKPKKSWVRTYLEGIGFNSSINANFEAAGIVTPAALAQLEVAHFAALGVTEADDRRKLFFLVQRVRQETENRNDAMENNAGEAEAKEQRLPMTRRRSKRLQQKQEIVASEDENDDDDNGSLENLMFPMEETANVIPVIEEEEEADHDDVDEPPDLRVEVSRSADEDDTFLNNALATPREEGVAQEEELSHGGMQRNEPENSSKLEHLDSFDSMDRIIADALQTPTSVDSPMKSRKKKAPVKPPISSNETSVATQASSETLSTSTGTIHGTSRIRAPPERSKSNRNDSDTSISCTSAAATRKIPQQRRSQLQAPTRKKTSIPASSLLRTGTPLSSVPAETELPLQPPRPEQQLQPMQPNPRRLSVSTDPPPLQQLQPTGIPNRRLSVSSTEVVGRKKMTWNEQISLLRTKHTAKHEGHDRVPPHEDTRIRVVVRKRPPTSSDATNFDILHALECCAKMIVYQPKKRVDLSQHIEVAKFAYDQVFNDTRCNREVYETAVRPVLPCLFEHEWVTVLCYGQTGSGKTHTMVGVENDKDHLGIYAMAALDIFHIIADTNLSVQVSMFEIYNGKLLDLLQDERTVVQCWEDQKGQVCFPGLSQHHAHAPFDLLAQVQQGFDRRATGSTSRNADSSRSHAVLQVHLYDDTDTEVSRLTLMDLAGSERASDTYEDAATRAEGAEINTSLLALKEVIRALAVNDEHVPYRGSKLTQVLKPAFRNAQTVLIACVAPDWTNCDPMLNTLRYADRIQQRDANKNRQNELQLSDRAETTSIQSRGSGLSIETNTTDGSIAVDPSGVLDDLLATPQNADKQNDEFVAMYNELVDVQLSLLSDEMDLSTLDKQSDFDQYITRLQALQQEQLATIEMARELLSSSSSQQQQRRGDDDSFEDLRD